VLTLGIDLSASDAQTAACFLDWRDGAGTDEGSPPILGVGDDALLAMMERADKVGIDAPFGWPDTFREMVNTWSEEGAWDGDMPRNSLRYRLTDQFQISQGRTPLSVSSDRIASTAMRCADILAQHYLARDEALDRVAGHVVEVYPAAALVAWGFDVKGYKDREATEKREQMLERLIDRACLRLSSQTVEHCAATDHALDALVSTLAARAQALGLTHPVSDGADAQVAREGWIHLPFDDSLERLAG
jgi:predicted nuclease with RNAse H fold